MVCQETYMNSRKGYFGKFGGRFVSELLVPLLDEIENAYQEAKNDQSFQNELYEYLQDFAGRPTPIYFAERVTEALNGAKVYLKREDLLHTGAHKINNTLGQILLARRMGKTRIIAETGAGQHGLATATVAAKFGMKCIVYMGEEDIKRQSLNVYKMKMLGTEVRPVGTGSKTLKDAINETLRDWASHVDDTFYIIGSVVGPSPYPEMVRDFQSVIGRETREYFIEKDGRLPDYLIACVGGGSNSIGFFYPFLDDSSVNMYGVEAGGLGLESGKHGASLIKGEAGVLHGALSYVLQDDDGQIQLAHSISAGLDYPGVGPELSFLKDSGRVTYVSATDKEALDAFHFLTETEGILPALEPSHAMAFVRKFVPGLPSDSIVVVNLSGRGDKDLDIVAGTNNGYGC